MALGIPELLLLLGIGQGLFLTVLILHKHGRLFANRFLGGLIGLITLILAGLLFGELNLTTPLPHLGNLFAALALLSGPLYFLYARHLLRPEQRFAPEESFHFLPFFGFLLAFTLLSADSGLPAAAQNTQNGPLPPAGLWLNATLSLQGIVYMGAVLALQGRHSRHIKALFSDVEQLRMHWLQIITLAGLVIWLIFALETGLLIAGINLSNFDLSSVLAVVYIYVLGYLGMLKSEILLRPAVADSLRVAAAWAGEPAGGDEQRYRKSGLSAAKARQAHQALLTLMERDELYRDNRLNLAQLAERLGITPHNLSEVINLHQGETFFDLVNRYRLEAARRDLRDPAKRHLTILAIALEAGFNSKSSFNSSFKKAVGMTPSAYRDRNSASGGIQSPD